MPKQEFCEQNSINVLSFGADKTGIADSEPAFARAVLAAVRDGKALYIPCGRYRMVGTWQLPSHAHIFADPCARIFADGEHRRQRGEFLVTNDAAENGGNTDISITGGVWDGNNTAPGNAKPDIFDPDGYSGTVLNFCGVTELHLSDMVVANSVTYNIRMARIEHFTIENISFLSDTFGQNQDGLHFNGEVRHGFVRNIRALSRGQTNDDLIALNADDSMVRTENYGMVCGAIEDIVFENLYAEDCHTILRLLSVTAPIRDISIRGVYGGYRCYAINADGARYCRTPLFREEDFPDGCGTIQNVRIEDMVCFPTTDKAAPAVCLESVADGLTLCGFKLLAKNGSQPALLVRNIAGTEVVADGTVHHVSAKNESLEVREFGELIVRKAQ